MKLVRIAVPAVLLLAGCSRSSGPTGEPVDRMFDAGYERFISSAKAHKGGCEISLSAKGDGGSRSDGVETTVEVGDDGSYRLHLDNSFELVRVGSLTWQREKGGKFERVESGARSDLMRDDAIAGWRDALRPMRDRLKLTRAESTQLGERELEVYTISAEPGGGADGGVQVVEGKGAVALDAATGFPVKMSFEGSWEGPATPPAEGRVTWTVQKMECEVTELGGVEAITPAIPLPTVAPAATTAVKPAATPTPVPAAPRTTTKTKTKQK
jgi:hypothetical protein